MKPDIIAALYEAEQRAARLERERIIRALHKTGRLTLVARTIYYEQSLDHPAPERDLEKIRKTLDLQGERE